MNDLTKLSRVFRGYETSLVVSTYFECRERERERRGWKDSPRRSVFQVHVSSTPSNSTSPSLPFVVLTFTLTLCFYLPWLWSFSTSSFRASPLAPPPPLVYHRVVFRPRASLPSSFFTAVSIHLLSTLLSSAAHTTLQRHPRKPFELSNPLWISPYATYPGSGCSPRVRAWNL